jgi:NAD(P)-dependent dehydrogenase (short-subunit alcohol dehydrogenase family)
MCGKDEHSLYSMARVWVTGSGSGIGAATAQALVGQGHEVLLHARRPDPSIAGTMKSLRGAIGLVSGDLESMAEIRALAEAATGYAPFDAIIHNAGVLERGGQRPTTVDGLERTFAVNVIAPYLLTALVPLPGRLVYLSSQLHQSGRPDFDDLHWEHRRYQGNQAYCDSKLAVTAIAFAVAARQPQLLANAVDPCWVRSRMGGRSAPVSLADGAKTPVRLAVDRSVRVSGRYFTGGQEHPAHPSAGNTEFQQAVLDACEMITGRTL